VNSLILTQKNLVQISSLLKSPDDL